MLEFCACRWEITCSSCHRRELTGHRVTSSWRLCLLVQGESEADTLSASWSEHFSFFFFCRPATSVKSRAGRAKQPLERAWPVTGMAAGKLSMSPGEFPTASTQEYPQLLVFLLWLWGCTKRVAVGSWANRPGFILCEGYLIHAQCVRGTSPGRLRFHQWAFPAENQGWGFP